MFTINFLVDPEDYTHGCWVVDKNNPTEFLEAAWATEEGSPKSEYPKGWTIQPYSHEDLKKVLQMYYEVVQDFEWEIINPKELEGLWFGNSFFYGESKDDTQVS